MINFMWFLLIPACFQLFALVRDQKARHKELLSRLDRGNETAIGEDHGRVK